MNVTENNFLDVSKVLSGERSEITFEIKIEALEPEENGICVSSVLFSGRAYDLSGFARLTGTVSAELSAPCARCLAPVNQAFSVEVDFPIATGPVESEEEVIVAEGEKIDLDALTQEILLVHLPWRLLCREDCKGLCPKCGKDLNEGSCDCDHKEIDPRLAGLADFFK